MTLVDNIRAGFVQVAAAIKARTAELDTRVTAAEAAIYERGDLPPGADLNDYRDTKHWTASRDSLSATIVNWPPQLNGLPGHLEVMGAPNGLTIQRVTGRGSNHKIVQRYVNSVTTGAWSTWAQVWPPPVVEPSPVVESDHSGITNRLLVDDFVRRRGGRKPVSTGVVSLRFDHGLANFNTKIRPLLEARNIPYSLALCSGQWERSENVGVTPAMVDGWVQGGLAEIWNHTKDHGSGDNSEAQWQAGILDGLTELRAQLPSAQIDGFAVPGSAGTDFGGFVSGASVAEVYGTDGGRFILSHHAITSGYMEGTLYRLLDGNPRQALSHVTGDKQTPAQLATRVTTAINTKTGLQVMIHPSLVDTAGHITTAEVEVFLDNIVAERDAGRVAVMGPYDMLLADTTRAVVTE